MITSLYDSESATLKIYTYLSGDSTSVFTYLSTTECSQYPSAGSDTESRVQKGRNMWSGALQVWCGAARYAGELRPNEIWELFLLSFLEVLPLNHLMGSLDQKEMALTPTYLCFENVNLRRPRWPSFGSLLLGFCTFFWGQARYKKWWKDYGLFDRLAHSGWDKQFLKYSARPSEAPTPPLAEAAGRLQVHDFS